MAYRLPPTRLEVDSARRILGIRGAAERTAVVSAWKAALRVSHPDAVEPSRKADAEERTKQINEAKVTLIEAIERGFPDGLAPAGGRRAEAAASRSRSGGQRDAPSGRPPTTVRPAPSPSAPNGRESAGFHASPTGPAGNGGYKRVHVPSTPAWTPAEGRWLMVGALVVACLLALAVVALTREGGSDFESRIEAPGSSAPESRRVDPVPTRPGDATGATPGVAFGAEPYAAVFLVAAHENAAGGGWRSELVHPNSRVYEVQQIISLLADDSVTEEMVMLASKSVMCDLGGGPGTGQSRCHVDQPSYLVGDLEFREDGDSWKLVGLWHGPR